ncbi:MAG TPA: XdhC family protein [Streptosporangiaceae bacterium]|nr:XdhC family protein [Streptosporangiaceae bacterium]
MSRADLLARAAELRSSRTPFVMATVVRALRPTSATPGDQAIVLPDGVVEGFVGGACALPVVRLHALRLLASGQATLLRIVPGSEPRGTEGAGPPGGGGGWPAAPGGPGDPGGPGEGIITAVNPCLSGGTLDLFLEVVRPPVLVHVFGDTPVAHALADLGRAMGWDIRRYDDPGVPVRPDTSAVVVASQGGDEHRALTSALDAGVPYVGLVASRRRGAAVVSCLEPGEEPGGARLGRLHTPAGLDIGARAPGEVAVSILAEIISTGAARRTVPPPARGPVAGTPGAVPQQAEPGETGDAAWPGGTGAWPAGPAAEGAEGEGGGMARQEPVQHGAGAVAWKAAPAEPAAPGLPGEATDPVCGMTVAAAPGSPLLTHGGEAFYFCSPGCRDAFAADPAAYTGKYTGPI